MRRMIVVLTASVAMLVGLSGTALAWPPDPPDVTESQQQLAALTVAPPLPMDGYSRDRFPHWSNQGDSCSTREVVLKRDGTDVEVGADCYPESGRWYSVFDQVWVEEPADITVDHMVPLANAWRSGAQLWDDDKREEFANDLDRGQLITASKSSNSGKGDKDPSEWKPPNTGWWCTYARHWIDVKYDWSLTITSAEKPALQEMLESC